MHLCVFFESGKTFTFHDVEFLTNNETMIVFTYTAASNGEKKKGTFYKAGMAGFSKWPGKSDAAG